MQISSCQGLGVVEGDLLQKDRREIFSVRNTVFPRK